MYEDRMFYIYKYACFFANLLEVRSINRQNYFNMSLI